jgi:DNA-binding Lrp family transcriptional regulator
MKQTMSQSSSKWQKFQKIRYTQRDLLFLLVLLGIKYMTTMQICELFWLESIRSPLLALKACQRRLRQLEKYGVIRRIHQAVKRGDGSKPDLFKLAANSIPLLEQVCGVNPQSVDIEAWADEELNPKIKHILATTDVHIAFQRACRVSGYQLADWTDESALRNEPQTDTITLTNTQGKPISISIIPDVRFVLRREDKEAIYRLEVDRATIELEASREQKRSIAQKMKRYLLLEKSEAYKMRYGTRPLRVLWAVKGERRMHNMLNLAGKVIKRLVGLPEKVPADEAGKQAYEQKRAECQRLNRRFLFTTLEQISHHNPLTDPIWHEVGCAEPKTLV